MSRSEEPCNSAENRDPMLSTVGLGSALLERLRVAKNSLCAGDQTTAIRTWRYTLALALTTSPKPTFGG
jgi:hypothetical protein